MIADVAHAPLSERIHPWLKTIQVAFVPGETDPVIDQALGRLRAHFSRLGHGVQDAPDAATSLLVTTATYGQPLDWRKSVMLTGRRRFGLEKTPTTYTLLHVTSAELKRQLDYFEQVLRKEPPDPADFALPGLAETAYRTMFEQGRRGGPIMSLIRMVQAQSKCIRIVLLVGEAQVESAYYFDLVGGYPHVVNTDPEAFYDDMVRRIVTSVSTGEVTKHQVTEPVVTRAEWQALRTPQAMKVAGAELGRRNFFTEMVRVQDLASVPAIGDSIASQYSEGCFATWDAQLKALIATITGSARPVEKQNLTDDELAVIVGVRSDGLGAVVRHVEGKRNDSPSSEAVELRDLDFSLPAITLSAEWGADAGATVPVVRSKLHGHRGVAAYDPAQVEFVALDTPYYHYPVSCATEAQARAIKAAFGRAECLRNPDDPRTIAFTVLPTHGLVVVEKWIPGKAPLQALWEAMDSSAFQVDRLVAQGPHGYEPDASGRMVLREP
jgi:hypothetical protein